jgi:hypothetical protein
MVRLSCVGDEIEGGLFAFAGEESFAHDALYEQSVEGRWGLLVRYFV